MTTVLAKNIEYLLNKNGINAYQLQDKSNIAQSTTFRIINGDTKSPGSATVQKYANYFDIPEEKLRFTNLSDDNEEVKRGGLTAQSAKTIRRIPILSCKQAEHFYRHHDNSITDKFEHTCNDYADNVYWLVVEGLSMVPNFNPKELVLIDPNIHPTPGDYVAAIKKGEKEVTLKKWRPRGFDEKTGEEYSQLMPLNPDFPAIDSRHIDFEICGVAIEQKIKLR